MTCTLTQSLNHASNGTSHTPSPIAQYNTTLLPPKELTATPIALASSELQSSLSASHQIYPTGMHTIATGRKTQRIDQTSPTHLDIHRWWSPLTEAVSHFNHSLLLYKGVITHWLPSVHARTTHTHTRTHTHTHTQLTLMDCTQLTDTLAQVLTSRKSLTTSLWMFTLIVPSHFSTNLTYTVTFQDDGCITRTEGAIDWRVAGWETLHICT